MNFKKLFYGPVRHDVSFVALIALIVHTFGRELLIYQDLPQDLA